MLNKNIAFFLWNPFQLSQFKNLIKMFPDSTVIVIDNGKSIDLFSMDNYKISGMEYRLEIIPKDLLVTLDDVYDVIFFQSPFPRIEEFNKAHLVSVQYGLSKERHNYGEWRALADINLMYGLYSERLASHFSPSATIGNPKFYDWHEYNCPPQIVEQKKRLGLDNKKKTVLYLPTWGDLGTYGEVIEMLYTLVPDYNIIVRVHHNDQKGYEHIEKIAKAHGIKWYFNGAYEQLSLLSVSDVVISDFSGAIFDAIQADKPVVLYQGDVVKKVGVQKFDIRSIEYARREEIGLLCHKIGNLKYLIDQAIEQQESLIARTAALKKELIADIGYEEAMEKIHNLINWLMRLDDNEVCVLSKPQLYVRELVKNYRALSSKKNKSTRARRKSKIYPLLRPFRTLAQRIFN